MEQINDLFWRLHEPEHQRVRAFCRKLTGNRDDGDDLYQDALVIALTNFGALRDPAAFRPWLYRIVVNAFKNRVRRSWWRRLTTSAAALPDDRFGTVSPEPCYAARRRLERAFRALTADERALITLFELDGWSVAELAVLYRKSEGSIKVRLFRTRKKLRRAVLRTAADDRTTETALTGKDEICVAGKPGEN